MTFRLLDAYVGWDAVTGKAPPLTGLDDPAGVRLPRRGPIPDGPSRDELLPWFPDPRLAPARPGLWYLLTGTSLLRREGCGAGFAPVRPAPPRDSGTPASPPASGPPDSGPLVGPVAVAASGHWLAVADRDRVLVWWRQGAELTGVTRRSAARIALAPDGTLVAADEDGTVLRSYAPDGHRRRTWTTGLAGRIDGLRIGPDHRVWLLTVSGAAGGRRILVADRIGATPVETNLAALTGALPPSTLASAVDAGFCLRRPETVGDDGSPDCYDWSGRSLPDAPADPSDPVAGEGELATGPLDSGLSRCRWHRVRVTADVPPGTSLQVSVAVTEDDGPAGLPHDGDWQHLPPGATDALLSGQPPGRYLYLRLRLTSDGTATPVVRRIRLDFPRRTSADLLPAAFREEPDADDFTERFLSLFDATLGDADRVVDRYPALLAGAAVPGELLPWLGGLLGLAFEAGWSDQVRRDLIAAAPRLYRTRGTPAGVREAVRIVCGVEPVIRELAAERRWLRLGVDGRLGVGHLFGRGRARMRVGGVLGGSPLHSAGDPYADPVREHAYRIRVWLPARPGRRPDLSGLARLVRQQSPAHTVAEVRGGGLGWVVGVRSVIGVDTTLAPLPPAVLGPAPGAEPLRLNRQSVLATRRRGNRRGITVGEQATVGVTTVVW
jgi:phage tail-like protein